MVTPKRRENTHKISPRFFLVIFGLQLIYLHEPLDAEQKKKISCRCGEMGETDVRQTPVGSHIEKLYELILGLL